MDVRLRGPLPEDEAAFMVMIREWEADGSRINPGIMRLEGRSFAEWYAAYLRQLQRETCPADKLPNELFFLVDRQGALHGGCSIRSGEPEELYRIGGHIAYGIRPSSRGRGYGKQQLRLLLALCRERGLTKVLLTCRESNAASRGIILACGGVYEDTVPDSEGIPRQRYWIVL